MVLKKKDKNTTVSKKKSKRWKKGQSCVSNPDAKQHRNAAKNRFFNVVSGPSSLTQEAIAKHEAATQDRDGDVALDDDAVSDAKSASSWATNWTECTNVTFNKIHRYGLSHNSQHKAVLAVLAAITEVIKSNGGTESDTEYFAALMTALDGDPDDIESLAAITFLLHMCMKRVSVTVLKNKFSAASKVLMNILAQNMNSDSTALLRSTLQCLSQLLRVQDSSVWSVASTMNAYSAVLTFTVHSKPKVRKAAQNGVCSVLRGSVFMQQPTSPAHHPAAVTTAKFCTEQIEACGGSGEASLTLHILGLLQEVLPVLPPASLKSVCETVLKVMTLANVIVSSVSMRCLHKMFAGRPKSTSLSAELNAQIITALYDYQPGDHDYQLMSAWLSMMKEAHSNLRQQKVALFLSHLPRYVTAAMKCLKGANAESAKLAAKCLTELFKEDLTPLADQLGAMATTPTGATPTHKLFKSVEAGLSYQYHASWALVLDLLAGCFEALGKTCHKIMNTCLHTLADLRDSHNFAHKAALDRAVGAAVRAMGPRVVLAAIPLQITGQQDNYDFPRSWLLPVLRDNVRDTELSHFTAYFLPLAARLREKALQCKSARQTVEAKTYEALQLQIWSLLPGYCTRPTDIIASFKGLAKVLGLAVRDRDDIRMDVLASLRKLVLQNVDNEAECAEIAKFAKNYLPLFFNLYLAEPEEKDGEDCRQATLETVKVYGRISGHQLLAQYLDMCLDKGGEDDISNFRRYAMLDIIIALIPNADHKTIAKVYPSVEEQLQSTDRTVQKKAYRVLEEICSSSAVPCRQFVSSHLAELQECLLTSLSCSTPSAKAPRLRCLIHIIKQLEDQEMDFVQKLVPEAVLCTKEAAEKARAAAYVLLVELVQALFRWNPDTPKAAVLQIYYEMLFAGLAGKPHMIVCTELALGRVTHQYKDYVSDELLSLLVESACMLLCSRAREVVRSALSLLKVLVTAFDDVALGRHVGQIVTGFASMKDDSKHQLRAKTKELLTRLTRKFGYESILRLLPPSHHKLLANIRKTAERAKRKREARASGDGDEDDETEMISAPKGKPESFEEYLADSDSDIADDDADTGRRGKAGRRGNKKAGGRGGAWLQEGDGDDVVDFLDPGVTKKVMATKPQTGNQSKKRSADDAFKMAPDGRMIIRDEDEEEAPKGKKAAPVDDLDELLDAFDGPGKKRKRKAAPDQDLGDDDETSHEYKAGGSGIHRPLKTPAAAGAAYKAKKAGGDKKLKGKHEPYAYVPLAFSSLNKRKKAKSSGQFKGFVKAAKKGAQKGTKMHGKKQK